MPNDTLLQKCIDAVDAQLQASEAIVGIRRAYPIFGRANTFTRYKVEVAKLAADSTRVPGLKYLVVSIPSNPGPVEITASNEIPDL